MSLDQEEAGWPSGELRTPPPRAAPPGRAEPLPWRPSLDDALLIARASGRPVLLLITAPWSDWSQRLLRETVPDVPQGLLEAFIRVHVDGDADPGLVVERRVDVYPTALVLDGEGNEIGRVTGFRTATEWTQALWPLVPRQP